MQLATMCELINILHIYIYIYIPGPSDLLLSGRTTQDFNKSGLIVVPPVGLLYLRQDCSTSLFFLPFLDSACVFIGNKYGRTVTTYTSNYRSMNKFYFFRSHSPSVAITRLDKGQLCDRWSLQDSPSLKI